MFLEASLPFLQRRTAQQQQQGALAKAVAPAPVRPSAKRQRFKGDFPPRRTSRRGALALGFHAEMQTWISW